MNEELFGSDDSKDIKYDNSTSQIEADNVQGAIDYILKNGTGNSSDMELTYAECMENKDKSDVLSYIDEKTTWNIFVYKMLSTYALDIHTIPKVFACRTL